MKKTNKKGFTLIELLVVVAIIGILAAIAIPQFSKYRVKAFNKAAQSDLRNFKTAMESAYADNQSYPAINNECFTGPLDNITTKGGDVLTIGVSKNVTLCAYADNSTYKAAAKHVNGDKIYQTTETTDIKEVSSSVNIVIDENNLP